MSPLTTGVLKIRRKCSMEPMLLTIGAPPPSGLALASRRDHDEPLSRRRRPAPHIAISGSRNWAGSSSTSKAGRSRGSRGTSHRPERFAPSPCARPHRRPLMVLGEPLVSFGARACRCSEPMSDADGRLQVTYNHHRLYSFVDDMAKNKTSGETLERVRRRVDTPCSSTRSQGGDGIRPSTPRAAIRRQTGYGY